MPLGDRLRSVVKRRAISPPSVIPIGEQWKTAASFEDDVEERSGRRGKQHFDPDYVPAGVGPFEFEMNRIGVYTCQGFEQTIDERLHVLSTANHVYSDDRGKTWVSNPVLFLPTPTLPGSEGAPYTEADRPCPFLNVQQYEIDNAVCLSTSPAFTIQHNYIVVTTAFEDASFCTTGDRLHAFYRYAYFKNTHLETWTCYDVYIVGNNRDPQTGLCDPVQPPQFLGQFTIGGPSDAVIYSERQRFMLYTKTQIDGLTWDGTLITIDSTFASDPDGVGTAQQESGSHGLVGGFEIRAASDGSLHFIWMFDGYIGSSQTSADWVKEIYYRSGPTGAKETVDQENGGAFVYHPLQPRVLRDPSTGKTLAMYRTVQNPRDRIRYRLRSSGGVWSADQFWDVDDTATVWTLRMHEDAGKARTVYADYASGVGNMVRLWSRIFTFASETWGGFSQFQTTQDVKRWGSSDFSRTLALSSVFVATPNHKLIYSGQNGDFEKEIQNESPALPGPYRIVMRNVIFLQEDGCIIGTLPKLTIFGGAFLPMIYAIFEDNSIPAVLYVGSKSVEE